MIVDDDAQKAWEGLNLKWQPVRFAKGHGALVANRDDNKTVTLAHSDAKTVRQPNVRDAKALKVIDK